MPGLVIAAAAAAAFNLVCTGIVTTEGARESSEPYSIVYRVALDRGLYCQDDCRQRRAIYEVQPPRITLDQQGDPSPGSTDYAITVIDRETGDHTILAASGSGYSLVYRKYSGRCELGPFTGFPDFPTKF